MLIRPFVQSDLARLIELTIETFRPFYEDSFRPLVGEVVFANQHGHWRDDYREQVAGLHVPDQHRYVAVAETPDALAGYVAWSVDPARRNGCVSHLAVSAGHRRQHVGTALCEHAFAEMRTLGAEVDHAGRVRVRPDLSIPGHPEVYVIGDLATLPGPDGKPYPGVIQVALQQGRLAAANVLRALQGEPTAPFVYHDLGNMATIGRHSAVCDLGWLKLKGYLAWWFWLFLHIYKLIGFRNRLTVMTQWAFSYLTYQRSVRLITGSEQWPGTH